MPSGDEPSASHPNTLWWIAIVGIAFAGAALADSPPTRVAVSLLFLLTGGLAFISFSRRGAKQIASWAGSAVSFVLALVVIGTSGGGSPSSDAGPSPEVNTSPSPSQTSTSSGTPSPQPSSSPKTSGATTASLPSPRDAERKMTVGSSAEFFSETPLLVGYGDFFITWASMSVASELDTCSASLDVGERAVVAGTPFDPANPEAERVWLRVTLLRLTEDWIRIRAERIIAVDEPESSPYVC